MALYTYESPEAGDLTFEERDVVVVTEREGEWWRGCIGEHVGLFPSNYVRPVELEVSQDPSIRPSLLVLSVQSSHLIIIMCFSVIFVSHFYGTALTGVQNCSSKQKAW